MSNYNYTEEFLGLDREMLAVYELTQYYPGSQETPEEPVTVELQEIYMDTDGTGDWVEFTSSEAYDEALREEILEGMGDE